MGNSEVCVLWVTARCCVGYSKVCAVLVKDSNSKVCVVWVTARCVLCG